jgi:uncharacterized RDD family membrane protein YckC
MPSGEPNRINLPFEVKPHAYDPVANPELFEDVLPRRLVAFVIDLVILAIPVALAAMFIVAAGVITFGLGFFLFIFLWPAIIIWAVAYYGITLGSPRSATIGMRVMDLEMRTWYGSPAYFVLGAVHAVLFWISVSTLTPFILLVGFLNERRRLLHDFLVGAVVINNEARANMLKAASQGC